MPDRQKIRLILVRLLCIICVIPTLSMAAEDQSNISPEIREQALSVLQDAVQEGDESVKVHAAEFLIYNNYTKEAQEIFEAEDGKGPAPEYRIDVWRVLVKAAGNDLEKRKKYLDMIAAAFKNPDGPDRLNAIETLGKLGYNEVSPELDDAAHRGKGPFQACARWVVANSGKPEDEAFLAELLDSSDSDIRLYTGYALSFFDHIQDETHNKLAEAVSKEPLDSGSRVYLVSSLYQHSKRDDYKDYRNKAKEDLLEYIKTGSKDERSESCLALAAAGGLEDSGILAGLLKDPEADVRVHAAHALFRIERRQFRGLRWPDWLVIGLYGAFLLGVGVYYSRRQTNAEEYFLASRNMNPYIIGISMFATLLSTISYLGSPGEMIKHGPMYALGYILIMPITYLVTGYILIPAIMKFKITSAYEILEKRLGLQVRICGSVIFMMTRLVWMAMLIYIAAKLMVEMLNWSPAMIPWVVCVAGIVAIIYTAMGGLRAVVVTDLFQFIILVGGGVLTIVLITIRMGGFGWVPTQWASHWDVQPFFSWNLTTRVTVFGSMIAGFFWWICTAGSDQVAIQRYLATGDTKSARRAFLVNAIADVSVMTLLWVVGFALLGFFISSPHLIPDGKSLIADADYLFPRYIANYIPVGLAGLVVAGMLAAAMSSLDSGINSIVTVVSKDFIGRFRRNRSRDEKDSTIDVRLAKYLVLVIGILVVLLSSQIRRVPGNILEVTNKTNGLFVGPLFGLFFMALFVRRANALGTIIGAIYGFMTAFTFAYWDVITGAVRSLSFQYIIPAAVIVHILVGLLLSWVPTKGKSTVYIVTCGIISLIPLAVFYAYLLK